MYFSTVDKVEANIPRVRLQHNNQNITSIKHIIAISSGRDRVGKNTIAVNVAITLAQIGSKVGLLDADPNNLKVSTILGLKELHIPVSAEVKEEVCEPVDNFGVKLVLIASLIDQNSIEDDYDNQLNQAISQILERVHWGNLDYLIVNFPPGIGDVQLALSKALPLYGVVMIAKAQQETCSDTYETLKMFEQLRVPVIGLVENMSDKITPNISKRKCEIRGGEKHTPKIRVPYLSYIPLDPTVPKYSDRGLPIVLAEPSSIFASALNTIVWAIASQITIAALKS